VEDRRDLILRHQLAVLQRRQPRRPNLTWADRALLATLVSLMPKARRHWLRLLVTPETMPFAIRHLSDRRDRPPCPRRIAERLGERPAPCPLLALAAQVEQRA
jgi:hypothetical protein